MSILDELKDWLLAQAKDQLETRFHDKREFRAAKAAMFDSVLKKITELEGRDKGERKTPTIVGDCACYDLGGICRKQDEIERRVWGLEMREGARIGCERTVGDDILKPKFRVGDKVLSLDPQTEGMVVSVDLGTTPLGKKQFLYGVRECQSTPRIWWESQLRLLERGTVPPIFIPSEPKFKVGQQVGAFGGLPRRILDEEPLFYDGGWHYCLEQFGWVCESNLISYFPSWPEIFELKQAIQEYVGMMRGKYEVPVVEKEREDRLNRTLERVVGK